MSAFLNILAFSILIYILAARRNPKLARLWVTQLVGWLFLVLLVTIVSRHVFPLWHR